MRNMHQLFESAICFTDIHFGLRHNSEQHNQDCLDFVDWMISQAEERKCKTCIFLGDWSHHRSTINLLTLDYTIQALRKLNNYFDQTYIIVGNHDIFYRDKRDIHAMVVAEEFENIVLVDEIEKIGDVALIPWLVGDEWKQMEDINVKYIFGHLEIPGFKMNARIEMPDRGEINSAHFKNPDYVFSGHFHHRQTKGNITYIGNPFGHNYSDIWDFDRGAMFLEWDKEPEFINYTDGPRFISIPLSSVIANPELYLKPKTYLRVTVDLDITYEEATFLRETFISQYNVREFRLIKDNENEISKDTGANITFKTVDQIFIECMNNIDSDTYDTARLIDIYNGL